MGDVPIAATKVFSDKPSYNPIPVIIVGFIESPTMAIWSLVIIFIAQQIQDNVLSPIIYGKSLDVHPLTTVILVLVGGDFYGIIGVLIALPVYMIAKIIFLRVYEIVVADREEETSQRKNEEL